MEPVCGIPAATIREVARLYARSERSIIFWGMGISQHTHGTDNARCLIALALVTGQVGRPGTGLHPLRGQNNVQGASDAGLIPMFFPDYKSVEDASHPRHVRRVLGHARCRPSAGLTVVEIMHAIQDGVIKGMYVLGENPAMSDPDVQHAREALAKLEHLVVQDLFLTETAWHADVVLPASAHAEKWGTFTNTNRQVQIARPVLEPARRGAAGLGADPGDRAAHRPELELQARLRGVRRDGAGDAVAQQHHLGAAACARTPSPIRAMRPTSPATRSSSSTRSRPSRAAPRSCRPTCCRPTSCPTRTTRWC